VSKKSAFDGQLTPMAITAALVLIIVGALASPRVAGRRPGQPTAESVRSDLQPRGPQVFRYYSEQPGTLDPALASDAYSSIVIAQIFSPLVGLASDLEPVPQVAESWTISRDVSIAWL